MKWLSLSATAVVFIVAIVLLIRSFSGQSAHLQAVPFLSLSTPTPIPTPTPPPELSDVSSPDGSMKIIEKKIRTTAGSVSYTFSTQKGNEAPGVVFLKTVMSADELILAPNGWSPDNRFVFVLDRQRA